MESLNIGFIDEDRQEIRRYRKRFRPYGLTIIDFGIENGINFEELIEKIYESDINLLMVDFLLNEKGQMGFNGDAVIREYDKIKPYFPMIIFTSKETQALPAVDNPNIIYDKTGILEDVYKTKRFVTILSKNIANYEGGIKIKENRINELITKREEGKEESLDPAEKAELYKLQFELSNLNQRTKISPDQLLVDLKLDQLSVTVGEAEKLLKQLKEQDNKDVN